MEGTNCEDETQKAFELVGFEAEKVHLKQFTGDVSHDRKRFLEDYDVLFIPGGWSAGDYVRAGAIFAARIKSTILPEIQSFIDCGKLVAGVCNGFQVLTELGLLPGFSGISKTPEAALTNNQNGRFQCRPTYLIHENSCAFTEEIDKGVVLQIPVAHAEGRFTFGEKDEKLLERLQENNQVVFRYATENGEYANGEFPWKPNGSLYDIAGIASPEGNVLGMMPHPERVLSSFQHADWTRQNRKTGDGLMLFESLSTYVKKRK